MEQKDASGYVPLSRESQASSAVATVEASALIGPRQRSAAATASGLVVEAAGVTGAVLGAGNPGSVGVVRRHAKAPGLVIESLRFGLAPTIPGS